ncbi:MAG TPA: maltotransferase domain-containing protein, partial [Candidatus Binataceae bacterium]|nr:maltotransferase domain-containing protein [Candidatus Binataceae bacterium]
MRPEIDCGRFAAKRVIGDTLVVEADVFADGHDELSARLLYRHHCESDWHESRMKRIENDRWRGQFKLERLGRYQYTVEGWIDRFETWRRDLIRRIGAGQDLDLEFRIGAELIDDAAEAADGENAAVLHAWARERRQQTDRESRETIAVADEVAALVHRHAPHRFATRY